MKEDIKYIIYSNKKGELSARGVDDFKESDVYLQGKCLVENAFRTFRLDRIIEVLDGPSRMSERLRFHKENETVVNELKLKPGTSGIKRNTEGKIEVCFTGFSRDEKEVLNKLSENKNLYIAKSVTVNLTILCCGENAGPKKKEDAIKQGCIILNKEEFLNFCETGEVPFE